VRASSHGQVDDDWGLDARNRGTKRPRLSLRRATATIVRGRFTIDVGTQFIRWGKTDILNPTDRFAPRDFLNVFDADFLPVTGVRLSVQVQRSDTIEAVWLPRFTPSRIPLYDQRWTVVPESVPQLLIVDAGAHFPATSQTGIRWSHVGDRLEYSASVFDGVNHLPNITVVIARDTLRPEVDLSRLYPPMRAYGADFAMPTRWVTVKGEAAYFTTRSTSTDEYVLYVIQLERQMGEWVFVGGYSGEWITEVRAGLAFAPDRGVTSAVVGRATYTIDPNRTVAFETAVRRTLDGAYVKAEYSQARGQHWRATVAGTLIRGEPDDFIGQYRRNSNATVTLRYSF